MTGIMGAMAQAMQGRDYGHRGESQVGDDIAAEPFPVRYPKPEIDPMAAMLAVLMFLADKERNLPCCISALHLRKQADLRPVRLAC